MTETDNKPNAKNVSSPLRKNLSGTWDVAIQDAEAEIEKAKARIDVFQVSIARFKEFKAKGLPFPSKGENQTKAA